MLKKILISWVISVVSFSLLVSLLCPFFFQALGVLNLHRFESRSDLSLVMADPKQMEIYSSNFLCSAVFLLPALITALTLYFIKRESETAILSQWLRKSQLLLFLFLLVTGILVIFFKHPHPEMDVVFFTGGLVLATSFFMSSLHLINRKETGAESLILENIFLVWVISLVAGSLLFSISHVIFWTIMYGSTFVDFSQVLPELMNNLSYYIPVLGVLLLFYFSMIDKKKTPKQMMQSLRLVHLLLLLLVFLAVTIYFMIGMRSFDYRIILGTLSLPMTFFAITGAAVWAFIFSWMKLK